MRLPAKNMYNQQNTTNMKKFQAKKTVSKRSPKSTKEEGKKPFSDMGIGFRVVEHVN